MPHLKDNIDGDAWKGRSHDTRPWDTVRSYTGFHAPGEAILSLGISLLRL